MTGDKVIVMTTAEDENGFMTLGTEISEKPQFMLDEEYTMTMVRCAQETVRMVCKVCYPNNREAQKRLAESIAKRAMEER